MPEVTCFAAAEHCVVWFLVPVSIAQFVLQCEVVCHIPNYQPGGLTGYRLSGIYHLTCQAGLDWPEAKTPAGLALRDIEIHKQARQTAIISMGCITGHYK